MANEKKLVKNITSRDENFAQWYTDVVREAELCDYSSVKGCLNYLPNGYASCELIQAAGILLRLPQVGPRRAGPRRGGAIVAGGGGA